MSVVKSWCSWLFQKGQITGFGTVIFLLLGMATIYFSLENLSTYGLKIIGLSLGLALMAVGGLGARAGALGFRPFTNDPLGWRKAKESYLRKATEDELKSSVDSSVEDSKK